VCPAAWSMTERRRGKNGLPSDVVSNRRSPPSPPMKSESLLPPTLHPKISTGCNGQQDVDPEGYVRTGRIQRGPRRDRTRQTRQHVTYRTFQREAERKTRRATQGPESDSLTSATAKQSQTVSSPGGPSHSLRTCRRKLILRWMTDDR